LAFAGVALAQTPTPKELGVYEALNHLRADPGAWANILKAERPWTPSKIQFFLADENAARTEEAVRDLEEAISALEAIRGQLPHLELSPGLSHSAADHARDSGVRGLTSHTGSDGSAPRDRIQRYGTWYGRIGENIVYSNASPRELIFQQLVDFGVPGRGHRETLLNPVWRYVGIACGIHATYHAMCVLDFASGYQEATASSRFARSDRPGMIQHK
jgi:uncharacterized protein YkwD